MKSRKIDFKKIDKFPFVKAIFDGYPKAQVYLVGGAVRDMIMKKTEIKDLDFVVRNVEIDELIKALSKHGQVNFVGKKFGVLKFRSHHKKYHDLFVDVALPRKEKSKSHCGKKRDFCIQSDPKLTIKEDLSRRDFTVNAIAYDLKHHKFVDPFHGAKDIKKKIIRCVGVPKLRFKEDYSRMMRAVRFSCQLGFSIEKKTYQEIEKMSHLLKKRGSIAKEVIATEFTKALYESSHESLRLFNDLGILKSAFSRLDAFNEIMISIGRIKKISLMEFVTKTMKLFNSKGLKKENLNNPSIYLILSTLIIHSGYKKGLFGVNYFGKSNKWTRRFCYEHKLPSAVGFELSCSKLSWIIKSMETIYNKGEKIKNTDLERMFFSSIYPSKDLLRLLYINDYSTEKYLGSSRGLYRVIKGLLRKMSDRGKLPDKLVDGHWIQKECKVPKGKKIAHYLDMIREEQLKGKIKTVAGVKIYMKKQLKKK